MKKRSFLFLLGIFLSVFSFPAFSQEKNELIAEEKNAVREIADRFETRLDELGSIEHVTKELFVTDYAGRYVAEEKTRRASETVKARTIMFMSGLFYDPRLLDDATEADWQELRIVTFDFMTPLSNAGVNLMIAAFQKGKEPKDSELSGLVNVAYPDTVLSLLDRHPILRNLLVMKEVTPITTVSEMRGVIATLGEALNQIRVSKTLSNGKIQPDTKRFIAQMLQKAFEENDREFGPRLDVADRPTFGYAEGTRFITLFSPRMYSLTIVKVGAEYRIVDARMNVPG